MQSLCGCIFYIIGSNILNKKNRQHILWRDWLTYDFILGILLQILILLVSFFFWSMKYPKLSFQRDILLNLLYLTLFFPFIAGVFGLWASTYELPVWTRFFTSISLPVLILGIVSTCVMCVLPPYCSSTTNPGNYLNMDRGIPEHTIEIATEIFPTSIEPGASNVSYRYYKYSSILENDFHLSLGETLSEESFSRETERLTTLPILSDAEISSSQDITLIDTSIDGVTIHITLDKAYNRIIYSAGETSLKH